MVKDVGSLMGAPGTKFFRVTGPRGGSRIVSVASSGRRGDLSIARRAAMKRGFKVRSISRAQARTSSLRRLRAPRGPLSKVF